MRQEIDGPQAEQQPEFVPCGQILQDEMEEELLRQKTTCFSFSRSRRPSQLHMCRKAKMGGMPTYLPASSLKSILPKRCTHTREDPELNQIQTQDQAKQDDWPEENLEEMPHIRFNAPYRIQTTTRA